MRLERLTLEKYGPYANRTLTFRADAALHIVIGRNEAGKSVALRALTDLFCGFPTAIKSDNYRVINFKSGDLRLGATLRHADGRFLAFRRRAARANTLLGAQDSERIGESLFREFTGAPERSVFKMEFGLTAGNLRKGAQDILAAGGRLAETLAAGSSQLSALNKIRGELQTEAAALFSPTGRARKLNDALEHYQSARGKLRDAIISADALKRARDVLSEAAAARSAIDDKLRGVERQRKLLERALRTRGHLRSRADMLARLAALADMPIVDESTFASWTGAIARETDIAQKITEAQSRLRELEREAAELRLAPDMLADAATVEALREMLGASDKSRGDLPRREEAARNGWQSLERAAEGLGLAGAEALVERIPTLIALSGVRDLLRKRGDIERERVAASSRLKKASDRKQKLEQSGPKTADDPAPLLRAFEGFSDMPSAIKRVQERTAELDEQAAKLEREAQRLHPAAAFDDLLRMPLPDVASIASALRRVTEIAEASRQLARESDATGKRIGDLEKSLDILAREGEIATREDVHIARRLRDEALDRIEAEPDIKTGERSARFVAIKRNIADADRLADILFGGAERATRRQALAADLELARREHTDNSKLVQANADAHATFLNEWRALWSACGFAPLPPEIMREWRAKAAALIERHESLSAERSSLAAAKAGLHDKATELGAFAARAGVEISGGGKSPAQLYENIREAMAARQKLWSDGRAHAVNLENAARDIDEARKDIADLEQRGTEIAEHWSQAMAILALPARAGLAEAEKAHEIWSAAIGDLRDYREDNHRVTAIRQDIENFEARTGELCARFCPDIAGETPRRIVEALSRQLDLARNAAAEMERLTSVRSKIVREIESYSRERAVVEAVIATAVNVISPGEDAIEPALALIAERRTLQKDLAKLENDLATSADGLRPEQLEAEQEGHDFDSADAKLTSLKAQYEIVFADVGTAAISEHAARKALDELERGRDAPLHAIEKEEAAAGLLEIARDWLLRAGAAKLAVLAIERHRQRNQDPVIARISELFARATGGGFNGVVIDYDDNDQPVLKGQRAGGNVGVEGLSEGTRDQLFLALRLALLEQRTAEPLPFVGDDLLTSFDEERTGCALDILAEFGVRHQTIIFTHHRHVVEIAKARLGGKADILELDR